MTRVSHAHTFLGPARDTVRRLTVASELPTTGAVVLTLLALVQVAGGGGTSEPALGGPVQPADTGTPMFAILLALLATAPVALARTQLLVAAATVTAVDALTLIGGYTPTVAAAIALVVLMHLVARQRPQRFWLFLLLALAFLLAVPLGAVGDHRDVLTVMLFSAVIAGLVGGTARSRAEAAARRESEESVAGTLLEHAARGERARIARELHDVVAHHISMISIQAETARLATPGMPAEGAKRLSAIGDTAREALSEMRRLLGVLREDADTRVTRAPQPGLGDLVDLIDEARASAAGASTRLIVRGTVTSLEPGVELTAYRIVQEALTNSRRHAPGSAVDVELDYADSSLGMRIRDNGPGTSNGAAPEGHGLLGMRERAAMVGGTLRAGPISKGFLVEATLPIERAAKP
jgi:signal transduction histidine kinase